MIKLLTRLNKEVRGKVWLVLAVGLMFVTPLSVRAQGLRDINSVDGVATLGGFESVFNNIVVVTTGLVGIVLFIMLIMGGVQFITSGGQKDQVATAGKTITYALLGLVLFVAAFLILRLLGVFTGTEGIITVFRVVR